MSALPDYAEALERALRGIEPLKGTEAVPVSGADGRVLRKAVVADRDLPPFDRAQLDGYAVRGAEVDCVKVFPVHARIAAGDPADVSVPPGQCVAIATGAPVPAGLDTVIPHEQSDRGSPVRFTINAIEIGNAVHRRGADARRGDTLIPPGTVLGSHHLGISAAAGYETLVVAAAPRVTILTSGDEVVAAGAAVAAHEIRNSNAPMAMSLLRRLGARPVGHAHLPDEPVATLAAVREALKASDLLVTVGGISAGERDCFASAFEKNGVKIALQGAAIQPGRPIVVGRAASGCTVLGLPGNPVSVLACACLFGWPIVRRLLGLDASLPWREVELAEPVKPNPKRRAFRPAILLDDGRARVPEWAGSGDLAHTSPTAGLLELPVQTESVAPGALLRFLPWP